MKTVKDAIRGSANPTHAIVAVLLGGVLAVGSPGPAVAGEADGSGAAEVAGAWEGELSVSGTSLRLVFHLVRDAGGAWSGTMDSPDQGATGIPVGSVVIEGPDIVLDLPALGGRYEGRVPEEGGAIEGTWSQGGRSFPLTLTRTGGGIEETEPPPRPEADVAGSWLGTLEAGVSLRLAFHVREADGGTLTGTLDSLGQGATGIPLGAIRGENREVEIEVPAVGGTFRGVVEADGDTIAGTWSQGGRVLPLILERKDPEEIEAPRRPQEPRPPFPYREESVRFPNPEAGIELAGTLTLPEGEGPFPAAVLITGSGSQDRDETVFGHRPFLVLADHLTRKGIAVLRYDDRGAGKSGGTAEDATSEDFATDALAGVEYLRDRPEIDREEIGLVGHSEGGLIAPLAATRSSEVAWIVLMAAPGVTGAEILYAQAEAILRAGGADEASLRETRATQEQAFAVLSSGRSEEETKEELRKLAAAQLEVPDPEERPDPEAVDSLVESQIRMVTSPWFRYFLTYDPGPTLERVSCPVLAINGELDLQVPADQNLPAIEAALETGGNDDVTTVLLPDLNHLFQTATTGAPAEYARIEETFSPVALETISDWILARTRNG